MPLILLFDVMRPERANFRLGLAIVALCRGTGAPLRRTQAPLGPFEIFWRLRRKILLSLWPLAYAPRRDDY